MNTLIVGQAIDIPSNFSSRGDLDIPSDDQVFVYLDGNSSRVATASRPVSPRDTKGSRRWTVSLRVVEVEVTHEVHCPKLGGWASLTVKSSVRFDRTEEPAIIAYVRNPRDPEVMLREALGALSLEAHAEKVIVESASTDHIAQLIQESAKKLGLEFKTLQVTVKPDAAISKGVTGVVEEEKLTQIKGEATKMLEATEKLSTQVLVRMREENNLYDPRIGTSPVAGETPENLVLEQKRARIRAMSTIDEVQAEIKRIELKQEALELCLYVLENVPYVSTSKLKSLILNPTKESLQSIKSFTNSLAGVASLLAMIRNSEMVSDWNKEMFYLSIQERYSMRHTSGEADIIKVLKSIYTDYTGHTPDRLGIMEMQSLMTTMSREEKRALESGRSESSASERAKDTQPQGGVNHGASVDATMEPDDVSDPKPWQT
ncbi:MAG: hypothetical protein J0L72_10500 [Armatimonadetes bacterium]|nr:hypothetical protein [Armatimonadota bacterium]